MDTLHRLMVSDARQMTEIQDQSIDLVVTSPPYPMIEMWDIVFSGLSQKAALGLKKQNGPGAFEAMHQVLDPVWQECFRVLKPGGFACINIGDATRTLQDNFALYPNHARILSAVQALGFTALPCILWRKQTNAPNKYMGSGMLPAGAYVTLEHEYILVLRKGGKRLFNAKSNLRRESAMFWEERNLWFSDVWMDLKGSRQAMENGTSRKRSGAFPFELAFRLINMYSVKGDQVLDPFMGTGTTMAAAMACGRHCLGMELDPALAQETQSRLQETVSSGETLANQRLTRHLEFTVQRMAAKGPLKYTNQFYNFPVMTRQETQLLINPPRDLTQTRDLTWSVTYDPMPQKAFCRDWGQILTQPDALSQIRATLEKASLQASFHLH